MTNVPKKHSALYKHVCIARATGPPQRIFGPNRGKELKMTGEVNNVHFEDAEILADPNRPSRYGKNQDVD